MIPETDLRIDIYRTGANSYPPQPENTMVRITHLPSGITTIASGRTGMEAKGVALADLETAVKLWKQ